MIMPVVVGVIVWIVVRHGYSSRRIITRPFSMRTSNAR
jgi:hypothetical protein